MTTKGRASNSKSVRGRKLAIQRRRRSQAARLFGTLATLAVAGVLAFWLWPRTEPSSPGADVSLDKSDGAQDAPVVVMEYGDFQCPACQRFFMGPARQLREEYVRAGQVRFVFRHFAFLGDESQWAAEASECANEQGRFWDYYDKLFQEQAGENVGIFSRDNLGRFAVELGLDDAAFIQCMDSGRHAEKVQQETQEGRQAGVRGTPSVFVNGRLIEGGSSYEVLRAAVDEALGK